MKDLSRRIEQLLAQVPGKSSEAAADVDLLARLEQLHQEMASIIAKLKAQPPRQPDDGPAYLASLEQWYRDVAGLVAESMEADPSTWYKQINHSSAIFFGEDGDQEQQKVREKIDQVYGLVRSGYESLADYAAEHAEENVELAEGIYRAVILRFSEPQYWSDGPESPTSTRCGIRSCRCWPQAARIRRSPKTWRGTRTST